MHAVTVAACGPRTVLAPAALPTPTPGPGQVLVEVTGAGVGRWDVKVRRGQFGSRSFPYVPGAEVSGLVAGLGDEAASFAVGDAVYGRTGDSGGYAEYAVADAGQLAPAPPGLDLAAAGAVPVAGVTALEGGG